jgi:hypothetical protein
MARRLTVEDGLFPRERQVLEVIVALNKEFGALALIEQDAVELVVADGPVAGTLASLAMYGYVEQRMSPQSKKLAYRAMKKGVEKSEQRMDRALSVAISKLPRSVG